MIYTDNKKIPTWKNIFESANINHFEIFNCIMFDKIMIWLFQLRLMYECVPMAFIIEQAGGIASDGKQPILDIVPDSLHQRSPIFIGSAEDVKDYLKCVEECK